MLASATSISAKQNIEAIQTTEGYPYNLLLSRTDEVKLIYSGEEKLTCHVEIQKDGQVWIGKVHNTIRKKFSEKPLTACMERRLAKKIVKTTFQ